ncbi:MAG: uroporphyrinogen decarboxylase family protein [Elusimicrobiota bacterium]
MSTDKLTTNERMRCVFEHKDPDRIPVYDSPWATTIARWRNEGMPKDTTPAIFFGLDKVFNFTVNNSPRFDAKVVEETPEYIIKTTNWGATIKNWKHATSTPEYIDNIIKTPDEWLKAKARMIFSDDRIPWGTIDKNYKLWREQGAWIQAYGWFGFDVTHSHMVGTERLLIAIVEQPEWVMDIFNTCVDLNLQLLDRVWEKGYRFDSLFFPDDMGYKLNQFFSVKTYREILKPVHKKAFEWAHKKGIKAHLHSCGCITPFIPELIDIGLDALNPLEVKSGIDPVDIKQRYGDKLVLHGGISALLWNNRDEMAAEMKRIIPLLKKGSGYIWSTDHSVPDNVSLEDFRFMVNLAKELGSY